MSARWWCEKCHEYRDVADLPGEGGITKVCCVTCGHVITMTKPRAVVVSNELLED